MHDTAITQMTAVQIADALARTARAAADTATAEREAHHEQVRAERHDATAR